ncbi:DUF2471 family protein [Cupriavidus malaysiensis]|uniref:Uncharacterized protein n=1 Tax=Cupriavidus malaysiensis TaxID=367825 RepID=A0ABM6F5V5_9BURK|nr:hypothetical protein [Cupriavidus malaysiensis]AOZ06751.1 hypothetical protein BKK80_13685 [Cupriavidus malaysiensis]
MLPLAAIESAIQDALPPIIARHRSAGHLTWKLLHQIEDEVMSEVSATGKVAPMMLAVLKSSPFMSFPRNDSVADLSKHDVLPIAFALTAQAWNKLH